MAQRHVVLMTDDLGDGDATQTIRFGLDNAEYEIDLNDKNADKLRADFKKYIEAGRAFRADPGSGRGRRGSVRAAARGQDSGLDTAAVREWAKANGHDVNARGRLSKKIIDAYRAAN